MNEKCPGDQMRIVSGHISTNSEQEAKEKIVKASRVGVGQKRYWEKSQINYEKSQWHLISTTGL